MPKCDKLCEILPVLLTKEENFMDLDKGIKDEMPMDKLEVEIANILECQDRILTWKVCTTSFIQTAQESVRVRVSNSS